MKKLIVHVIFTILAFNASAQNSPLGIFEGHGDIGNHVKPGAATYIPQTQQYIISGAGYNVWFDHDEFHYVYKRLKGDFILYTRAAFVGAKGVEEHRKVGWMVRKSLDSNAAHVNVVEHGDGLTSLQYRKTAGATTEEVRSALTHADVLQLERKGNTYTMRVARFGEPFVTAQVTDLDLGEEVYVGLFVGSHNADVLETGVFRDVRITMPFNGESDQNTRMTLGSHLELLEVATGNREIIYTVPYSIQAPNWMTNGKSLVFNDNKGLMYTFDLATRQPVQLNTGDIKNNNNDHVLSFDGTMLGLSSNVRELGGSIIYTVPVTGGTPKQVTPKGPSYLHGWSPDGKYLVFCGQRDGEFDVYRVPAAGGKEEKLTNTKGLDDGPEYSPDGQYIYFNSVRSGTMQIWRMHPDGSGQEQVTNDDLNNWFAHISPDGKWMVFLSFLKEEVQPGIHPPYKHVYLRLMPVAGGTPKVIGYVYGGQGSINTPSWSPDSKRIAFISNSDMSSK
ncbi:Periplasmic component of the Tol biopolymer transport system [Chitinophaga rupis]|uniref:Periplasmic component of the Tol biopolymer transport system n=1 Tax=Chitinophaga rupis TaxID=573321 RepID=A0A1H7V7K1_9BACT|nr:TolB family protein [Chitinophaga rupis]SEM05206.1 Periplasmic component of the Tol biopolymer transport system [Chitinophaga rupis]